MQRTWCLSGLAVLAVLILVGCETRSVAPATPRSPLDVQEFAAEVGVTQLPAAGDSTGGAGSANPVSSGEPSTDGDSSGEESPGETQGSSEGVGSSEEAGA